MGILLSWCPQTKSRCYHAPIRLGGDQGGSARTPQSDRQGGAIIPRREESVDEVLSIPETQSDRLSFPNLQQTAEEEEEEGEEDVEEDGEEVEDNDEEEEDDDDDGNDEKGSQDEADDGEEDKRREDTEQEHEVREHPPQEGGAPSKEVGFFFPLPLPTTGFYC